MNGHHGIMWLGGIARRSARLALFMDAHQLRALSSSRSSSTSGRSRSRGRDRDSDTTATGTATGSKSTTNVGAIHNTPHLKRKLGQHLLINEKVLSQIVDAAQIPALLKRKQAALNVSAVAAQAVAAQAEEGATTEQLPPSEAIVRILEIGPGTGNLTSALLALSPNVHVHSVEYDKRMVDRLQDRFAHEIQSKRLTIENIDFEHFAFAKIMDEPPLGQPVRRVSIRNRAKARGRATATAAAFAQNELRQFDACVANIPYQLSSIIISRLTNDMFRFPGRQQCAVLLVQEEFAARLLAKAGTQTYSRLSVNTSLIVDVTSVTQVGRENFLPPPKVDSRVIKLTPKSRHQQTTEEHGREEDKPTQLLPDDADKQKFFQRFDTLLRIAFTRKNKTLRAALLSSTSKSLMEKSATTDLSKDQLSTLVEEALHETGLTGKRAVQLPVQDFKNLMDALAFRGIIFRASETRHFRE